MAQSTSLVAHSQRCPAPLGPSQLGAPPCFSMPTPPEHPSPPHGPTPTSGVPPSPPRGLPSNDVPSAMLMASTPQRQARSAPSLVSPVLDVYEPIAPPMMQTYSRELMEDAKSWLQTTKQEQYMPPPPPPQKKTPKKKTPKKKVGGVDVEDFNDIPASYVYGKPLVWLHILTEQRHSSMRLYTWYIEACKRDVSFIEAKVPYAGFMHREQKIHNDFLNLHDMF